MEFLFAGADFAQAFESDAAEFAASPGERVGHVSDGDGVFLGELFVGNIGIAGEVVLFEQAKGAVALTLLTQVAKVFHGEREEAADPFLLEEFFERFRRRNR